ncbi:MAG: hypothetical protein OXG68_18190 [Chloroflexi bacterium]|nr:hypothetical protein [Chloroflexota bacterium]
MIQLSPRGQAVYQLLSLIVALLILYGIGFLAAVLDLLPAHPLGDLLEPTGVESFTERLFQLTILCGLVSGGIMMAGAGLSRRNALWLRRIWTALAIASVILAPFDIALPLDLAMALALLFTLAACRRPGETSAFLPVWQVGMALIVLSILAPHLLDGRALEAMRAFRLQVAYPIAALSIMFWLMRRYSLVEEDWAQDGLRIVALLVFLGGSLISLGRVGLPAVASLGASALIPLCYIILAGHSYRALRSRNENASLAPHWVAAASLFWLVGGGFLGALSIQPAISEAMRGTDLAAAQDWLAGWVTLAIVLAFVNESASSLRGDNRRVTGFAPLWLITFGVALATITLACRGVVQIYLRDVAAVEEAALAELLLPLTSVWIICLFAVAAGIMTYALGFWLRRTAVLVVDS